MVVKNPSTYTSFLEELQDMVQTTVLITPPGGIMFTSVFLPKSSFLIGVDTCLLGRTRDECGNMDVDLIFNHMHTMQTLRYTVEAKAQETDAELFASHSKLMNIDAERMGKLVGYALSSAANHEALV